MCIHMTQPPSAPITHWLAVLPAHLELQEDGGEFNTQVIGNLVIRTSEGTGKFLPTEKKLSAAYWWQNPANTFINNTAAGVEGPGESWSHGERCHVRLCLTLHPLSLAIKMSGNGRPGDAVWLDGANPVGPQMLYLTTPHLPTFPPSHMGHCQALGLI